MRRSKPTITLKLIPTVKTYRQLLLNIKYQREIGWDQLLRDRVTSSWQITQITFIYPSKNPSWPKQFIKKIITSTNSIWIVRNTLKLGKTIKNLTHEQQRLYPKINNYYLTYKTEFIPTNIIFLTLHQTSDSNSQPKKIPNGLKQWKHQ